ncbi:MAG: phasin family protein [Hydrogenophilus sp.]|nr:phasin family protein [Hydrogenophilus sp.]
MINPQTIEQLVNQQRKISEAWLTVANQNLALSEKFTNLTLELMKSNLERFTQQGQSLIAQKDPQLFWQEMQKNFTVNIEQMIAQQRQIVDLFQQHRQELTKVVDEQFSIIQKELAEMLDQLGKSSPAGSELVINAAKSALAAAGVAYENIQKAFKQMTEILEANLAAATNAASKAVSSAVQNVAKITPVSSSTNAAPKKSTA